MTIFSLFLLFFSLFPNSFSNFFRFFRIIKTIEKDNFWKDIFFALLVLSSRRSGGSSLGFRAGSL